MIDQTILKNLLTNEEYCRRVLPYLKSDYFAGKTERIVFEVISKFVNKYNVSPTTEALVIEVSALKGMDEDTWQGFSTAVDTWLGEVPGLAPSTEWLLDTTEKFCQEKAIYEALTSAISIMQGDDKTRTKGAIPEILTKALGVTLDPQIGHSFFDDAEERYDFYHDVEERIPFDIEILNKITKGGLPRKTLNVILGGVNVGKTLAMTHMAAANVMMGYNVLYITLEMSAKRIAERIDANLLDISLDDLPTMSKKTYMDKMAKIASKTSKSLIIEEFPTSTANVQHFRSLLNNLKLKKNFVPDIIYIDYINICSSSRYKGDGNMYSIIKAIAEEIRGLAVEFDVPIVSATQLTRAGFESTDVDITDVAESFGLPATADFMIALINNEELEDTNQYLAKQLKNRYGDKSKFRKFMIGVDRGKQRLYDAESSANSGIVGSSKDAPIDMEKATSKFKKLKTS